MKPTAAEAASPASFQPLNAQTITGARSSGRSRQITSCIESTVLDAGRGVRRSTVTMEIVSTAVSERVSVAELRPGAEVAGVFACSRKDRLIGQERHPLPGRRAA